MPRPAVAWASQDRSPDSPCTPGAPRSNAGAVIGPRARLNSRPSSPWCTWGSWAAATASLKYLAAESVDRAFVNGLPVANPRLTGIDLVWRGGSSRSPSRLPAFQAATPALTTGAHIGAPLVDVLLAGRAKPPLGERRVRTGGILYLDVVASRLVPAAGSFPDPAPDASPSTRTASRSFLVPRSGNLVSPHS